MKILIVSPFSFPVPAIKGGAVQTLIDGIIFQNERYGKIELEVASIYDERAMEISSKFSKTKFIYYKYPKIIKNIDLLISKAISKVKKQDNGNRKFLWKIIVIHKIRKLLKKRKYDAIVLENSAYLLNILRSKSIVNKYEDKIFYHVHNVLPKRYYVDAFKFLKCIAISNFIKKNIVEETKILNNKVQILRNGFNNKNFTKELELEERKNIKNKLGIKENSKVLIFVGRIEPYKGIMEILRALERIDRDDITLLIVGSVNFSEKQTSIFESKVNELIYKMKEKIVSTGYVPYEDIWKYYKVADIAILPSMWDEPSGLTIAEAMASGLPVITTNSGGIPEYMNSEFGVLLERDNMIVDNIIKNIDIMLENLGIWKQKGQLASQYISNLVNEDNYYNTFIKLIEEFKI